MKLKHLLATSAIVAASLGMSKYAQSKHTKDEVAKILMEIHAKENQQPTTDTIDITEALLDALDTTEFDETHDIVFRRKISELKKTPLYMSWVSRHTGEFLWYSQYDEILKAYNKDTLATDASKTISAIGIDTLAYPLIYDQLKDKIPEDLDSLLAQPKFDAYREKMKGEEEAIIITKNNDTRHSIAYYSWGKLFLASYVSIGLNTSTPQGLFDIQHKYPNLRSQKYQNAPMPYALQVHGSICIHQGKSNGQKKSHGCIRVPGLYQEALFHRAKVGTKVVIIP